MGLWRDEVIQPALDRDLAQAIAEQQAILERDARNAGAHYALGTLCQFQGDREAERLGDSSLAQQLARYPALGSNGGSR
jgi:hypothetical protein